MVKEHENEDKVERKAQAAQDELASKIAKQDGGKKRHIDDDLASGEDSDSGEYDDEEEEGEEESD